MSAIFINVRRLISASATATLASAGTAITAATTAVYAGFAAVTGSSLVGWIQDAIGAVARTLQDKARERISVTDFAGCDPTGATDSTAAFQAAKARGALLGGARIRIPNGSYMLTNFEMDVQRVIFEGETGGFSYEKITDVTKVGVRLFPSPTAIWVWRTKGGVSGAAGQGSGLKNAVVIDTAAGAHQYGVIEDCAGTILEDVTIQGFQYDHVMPAAANQNVHRRVARLGATKVGFLTSEFAAKGYMHPDVPDIQDIPSTVWQADGCVIRQNEFGAVIRDGIGANMGNTVIESNRQANIYIYRTDVSTVRNLDFSNVHSENGYDGFTGDTSGYSIVGNRAFLIGTGTTAAPIAWTAAYQAGFAILIDSQTHAGSGGPDNLKFSGGSSNCNNVYQKDLFILSGVGAKFNGWSLSGSGDELNRIKCTSDAQATEFNDPIWRNDPAALVPALMANFGANLGTRGIYRKFGTSFGAAELGASYPRVGFTGGPVHFLAPVAGDPRRAEPRCLDDYFELDAFAIPWRTVNAIPFTLNSEKNTCTKIGREVVIKCVGTMTVSAAYASPEKFFCSAALPYQAAASGNVVGQVVITATGGGATVVNNGMSPIEMNAIASAMTLQNVFPALTLGMTFKYQVELSYTTAT